MTDEDQIRGLIERWVTAVQARDLPGVLADHAADIVMFDVPPPHEGVRGLNAYRDSWPQFFDWLASGGTFELEIDAGDGRHGPRDRLRLGPLRHARGHRA